jgi:atypical dual specificity phosphatase
MAAPDQFSWIERPHLAASARPADPDELRWLRDHGIQIITTLSESPLRRDWVNDAGLMAVHVPVVDMTAPTMDQIEQVLQVIRRARTKRFGVLVHCAAGLGRTGTIVAAWFVERGLSAAEAIAKVRELRPGSVEVTDQEEAVMEFARQVRRQRNGGGTGG